jgi:hypothetical protein
MTPACVPASSKLPAFAAEVIAAAAFVLASDQPTASWKFILPRKAPTCLKLSSKIFAASVTAALSLAAMPAFNLPLVAAICFIQP